MNDAILRVGGVFLAAAVIAAVTALTWHGTINGEAAVGLFSTIVAGALTVFAHAAGAKAGATVPGEQQDSTPE